MPMGETLTTMLMSNQAAALVGLASLVVSCLGFAVTIYQVRRARTSAEAALNAGEAIKRKLRRVATVTEISGAVTALEEIKRLHRMGKFEPLPDRYSYLRTNLVLIKAENSSLSDADTDSLRDAIAQLAEFESTMDQHLSGANRKINVPRTNKIVSEMADSLLEVMIRLQQLSGDEDE